jgi:hypothetical protein
MPKFTAAFAYDVSCYRTIELTAKSPEAAIEKAKRLLKTWNTPGGKLNDFSFEPEWDTQFGHRLIDVVTDEDKPQAVCDGITLDDLESKPDPLEEAREHAREAAESLRRAINRHSPVAGIVTVGLIAKAATLKTEIDNLIIALNAKD